MFSRHAYLTQSSLHQVFSRNAYLTWSSFSHQVFSRHAYLTWSLFTQRFSHHSLVLWSCLKSSASRAYMTCLCSASSLQQPVPTWLVFDTSGLQHARAYMTWSSLFVPVFNAYSAPTSLAPFIHKMIFQSVSLQHFCMVHHSTHQHFKDLVTSQC